MSETRMLIAYDGSTDAGGAISAAARLVPTAKAAVVHVRDASMTEDVAAATVERGRAIAAEAGLRASAFVRAAPGVVRSQQVRHLRDQGGDDLTLGGVQRHDVPGGRRTVRLGPERPRGGAHPSPRSTVAHNP